jgi:hypothetical protein
MAEKEKKEIKKKKIGPIISFILFLIASAAVFYFGWVQFDLDENTYAVLFSKTSGYDQKVLEPGKFNWRWERILPTNSKIIKIKLENQSKEFEYEGSLPSSELYSSIIPQNPDFSFKMTFLISYMLEPAQLPALIEKDSITTADMDSFYTTIESEFIRIVKSSSTDFFNNNLSMSSNSYLDLESIILDKLKQRYSYLNIRNLTITYIHYPDLVLYEKTKNLYYQILDKRKEAEIASEKWAIESKVNLDTKLELLNKYGELLSKYPILIDYFALDPESQVLDISNLKEYKYESGE